MKISRILFVIAIALGMMACNNEDVPQLNGEKDASISIKVFPSSNGPSFRATGNLSGGGIQTAGLEAESAIKKLEVWVFSGDVLKAYGTVAGNEITNLETSIGLSTIVVTANTNIGIKGSKADVLNELGNLPPRDITINGLVMTAEPFDVTLVAGNNYYGYTDEEVTAKTAVDPLKKNHLEDGKKPLPITRVNARVALVSAELDYTSVPENQKAVFTDLKDLQVAMFNVPNQTKLFGTPLATNSDFQYGAKWPSPDFSYVGVDDDPAAPNGILYDALANVESPTSKVQVEAAPYYYVNENTSAEVAGTAADPSEKMIIVLRAKVYNGTTLVTQLKDLYTDEDGYTYYPIWVNALKDNYTYNTGYTADGNVYRNTQYNINLVIKGLGRPTIDEVDKAWLDVKVEVAPWSVVTQDVVWGGTVAP